LALYLTSNFLLLFRNLVIGGMLVGRAVTTSSNSADNVFGTRVSGRYTISNPVHHVTGIPHIHDIQGTSN